MELNPHLNLPLSSFVEANKNLIHHVAQRFMFMVKTKRYEYDDIFSLAAIGMVKAYRKYDPTKFEKVNKFSTYAVPLMIGEVQRSIRDDNPGPKFSRAAKDIGFRIRKNEWYDKPYEWIRVEILKENLLAFQKTELTLQMIQNGFDYLNYSTPRSIHAEVANSTEGTAITLADTIPTHDDHTQAHVDEFLSTLPEKHRKMLELAMKEVPQREIGRQIGVSQVQVSRLLKKVGRKLIKFLDGDLAPTAVKNAEKKRVAVANKPKGDVVKMAGKGNREEAIRLLKETELTYKEIEKKTGVPHGTIGTMAGYHRPKEVREKNRSSFHDKPRKVSDSSVAVQEVIRKFDTVPVQSTPPSFLDTTFNNVTRDSLADKLVAARTDEEIKKVSKEIDVFLESETPKADAPSEKSIGDAIQQYHAEVENQVRDKLKVEIRAELEAEMVAASHAEQASKVQEPTPAVEEPKKSNINRKLVFSYSADATDISAEEFIEELETLIFTVKGNDHEKITFSMQITAD